MKKIKRIIMFFMVMILLNTKISNFFALANTDNQIQNNNITETETKNSKINNMIKNLDFNSVKKAGNIVAPIGLCSVLLCLLKDNKNNITNETVGELLTEFQQEYHVTPEDINEIIHKNLSVEHKLENIRDFCLELSNRTDCRHIINLYYNYMIYILGNIKNNNSLTVINSENYMHTPEYELLNNIIIYWKEIDPEMNLSECEIYYELQNYIKNKNTWADRFDSFKNLAILESLYFMPVKLLCSSFENLINFKKIDYLDDTQNTDFVRFKNNLENIKDEITCEYQKTSVIRDNISEDLKTEIHSFLAKYFDNISGFEENLYTNIDDLYGKGEINLRQLIINFCKNNKLKPEYIHIKSLIEQYI